MAIDRDAKFDDDSIFAKNRLFFFDWLLAILLPHGHVLIILLSSSSSSVVGDARCIFHAIYIFRGVCMVQIGNAIITISNMNFAEVTTSSTHRLIFTRFSAIFFCLYFWEAQIISICIDEIAAYKEAHIRAAYTVHG